VLLVEHDEILIFADFVPTLPVDAYTGVHADPSACTMAFGDISYLDICAEILNIKAQTLLLKNS